MVLGILLICFGLVAAYKFINILKEVLMIEQTDDSE